MFKRVVILFIFLSLLLSACSAPAATPATGSNYAPDAGAMPPASPAMEERAAGEAQSPGKPMDAPAAERIVIRNASLSIVVDDPAGAMDTISRMAEGMGGYVVTSNLYKTTANNREVPVANITVRVPAERLNESMGQIKALVKDPQKDVLSENVDGQDVTKEYTDLNSRLKNLQDTEQRLREIMASAQKTEDVLAVNNQLTQIREQIEVIQGQIKYYEESSRLSSIAVQITSQAAVQPLEIGGWQPVGVARDAVQALINTMQGLATIAIWGVLYLLPVALVIFIPLRILWWVVRRGMKNQKVKTPPAPTQPA